MRGWGEWGQEGGGDLRLLGRVRLSGEINSWQDYYLHAAVCFFPRVLINTEAEGRKRAGGRVREEEGRIEGKGEGVGRREGGAVEGRDWKGNGDEQE